MKPINASNMVRTVEGLLLVTVAINSNMTHCPMMPAIVQDGTLMR